MGLDWIGLDADRRAFIKARPKIPCIKFNGCRQHVLRDANFITPGTVICQEGKDVPSAQCFACAKSCPPTRIKNSRQHCEHRNWVTIIAKLRA